MFATQILTAMAKTPKKPYTGKPYGELSTYEEFEEYYRGASKAELRARLKTLGENRHLPIIQDRERDAIKAWLS